MWNADGGKLLAGVSLAAALVLAACGRTSDAVETGEAPAEAAPAVLPLVPDVEAASIPTMNGVPLVPVFAPVNFLDPLEPDAVYRMPAEYNTNHTAVQIIKEEEMLQLEAYELGGVWLIVDAEAERWAAQFRPYAALRVRPAPIA